MAPQTLYTFALLFVLFALAHGTFVKLVVYGGCVAIAQQFGDIIAVPQCEHSGEYFIPSNTGTFVIYGSFDYTSERRDLVPDCFHIVDMADVRARGYDYIYIENNWSLTGSKPRSLLTNPWADRELLGPCQQINTLPLVSNPNCISRSCES